MTGGTVSQSKLPARKISLFVDFDICSAVTHAQEIQQRHDMAKATQ